MPNKNYISGRNFEYRVKKYLESKGYFVLRSAGSHTPVDLLAVHPIYYHILVIQCKHGTSRTNKKSLSDLNITANYFENGLGILAMSEKRKIQFKQITPALNLIDYKLDA